VRGHARSPRALRPAGLLKTTDTGQVDWSTDKPYPGNGNYASYYEIRSLPASGGLPTIFFRVEYGSQGWNSVFSASTRWRSGTGTDGAGNLINESIPIASAPQLAGSRSLATSQRPMFISIVDGNLNIIMPFVVSSLGTTENGWYSCERLKNAAMVDQATGFMVCTRTINAGITSYTHLFPSTVYNSVVNRPPCDFPAGSATQAVNGPRMGFFPLYPNLGGIMAPPQLGVVFYMRADMLNADTTLIPITLTINGRPTNYYAFQATDWSGINGSTQPYGVCVRME
jgi:hypothetical protein